MSSASTQNNNVPQVDQIDRYWANYLGYKNGNIRQPGVHLTQFEHFSGIFGLKVNSTHIFSISTDMQPRTSETCQCSEATFSPGYFIPIANAQNLKIKESYGPGYLLYADQESFCPCQNLKEVRPLTSKDYGDLKTLSKEVGLYKTFQETKYSWVNSFGLFQNGQLLSVAIVRSWQDIIGSFMVTTHPKARRQGFAKKVTSVATSWILSETSLIPQYDTDVHNLSSLKIARSLGFYHYGQIIYLRCN